MILSHKSSYFHQWHHLNLTSSSMRQMKWWWWYLTLILKSVPGASEADVVTMTLDTHHHTCTRGITDIWYPPVWGRWYLILIIILAWPPSMRQMEWWWWHLAWRWRYISKSYFVIKESQQLIQLFPSLHSWVPWESGLRWYQTHNKLVHLSNCKVQNTGECVYIKKYSNTSFW